MAFKFRLHRFNPAVFLNVQCQEAGEVQNMSQTSLALRLNKQEIDMDSEKKNYYMPLYFDDWIGGTYSMSSAARGVYIMLVIALAKGERVHASIDTLRRLGGDLNEDQYAEVLSKCRVANGFLVNDKVDRIMSKINSKRESGKLGGLTKRNLSKALSETKAKH